ALEWRERPVRRAVLRDEAGVVGVEREGAEEERLPLRDPPVAQEDELRRGVDVEHGERGDLGGRQRAVADRERDLVGAVLVVARGPVEDASIRVEEGPAR